VKPQYWLPTVVFLATSIPTLLLLNAMQAGGDFRVWIAIAAGALATALVQSRLKSRGDKQ
jgi:hypothetical protein